jgi:hypothetical protein
MSPKQPDLAVDTNLSAEQAQAKTDQITALQNEAQSDTANLMARYGTRLALAGATGTAPIVGSKVA